MLIFAALALPWWLPTTLILRSLNASGWPKRNLSRWLIICTSIKVAEDVEEEEVSLPVEWPGRANKMKEAAAKAAKTEPVTGVKEQPLVQNPVFHEPIVLTPEKEVEITEPETGRRNSAYSWRYAAHS